jgi:hypothetical protein
VTFAFVGADDSTIAEEDDYTVETGEETWTTAATGTTPLLTNAKDGLCNGEEDRNGCENYENNNMCTTNQQVQELCPVLCGTCVEVTTTRPIGMDDETDDEGVGPGGAPIGFGGDDNIDDGFGDGPPADTTTTIADTTTNSEINDYMNGNGGDDGGVQGGTTTFPQNGYTGNYPPGQNGYPPGDGDDGPSTNPIATYPPRTGTTPEGGWGGVTTAGPSNPGSHTSSTYDWSLARTTEQYTSAPGTDGTCGGVSDPVDCDSFDLYMCEEQTEVHSTCPVLCSSCPDDVGPFTECNGKVDPGNCLLSFLPLCGQTNVRNACPVLCQSCKEEDPPDVPYVPPKYDDDDGGTTAASTVTRLQTTTLVNKPTTTVAALVAAKCADEGTQGFSCKTTQPCYDGVCGMGLCLFHPQAVGEKCRRLDGVKGVCMDSGGSISCQVLDSCVDVEDLTPCATATACKLGKCFGGQCSEAQSPVGRVCMFNDFKTGICQEAASSATTVATADSDKGESEGSGTEETFDGLPIIECTCKGGCTNSDPRVPEESIDVETSSKAPIVKPSFDPCDAASSGKQCQSGPCQIGFCTQGVCVPMALAFDQTACFDDGYIGESKLTPTQTPFYGALRSSFAFACYSCAFLSCFEHLHGTYNVFFLLPVRTCVCAYVYVTYCYTRFRSLQEWDMHFDESRNWRESNYSCHFQPVRFC